MVAKIGEDPGYFIALEKYKKQCPWLLDSDN